MRSLWHDAQFCATSLFCASMDRAEDDGVVEVADLVEGPAPS
jgi:hypothetical protein